MKCIFAFLKLSWSGNDNRLQLFQATGNSRRREKYIAREYRQNALYQNTRHQGQSIYRNTFAALGWHILSRIK